MTKGGPIDSTQTIVFQAIQRGYGKQDISGGSAISVILFLIVLSVSLVQRYLTRDKEAK
jgi:multiple sugar transport system permease protein